MSKYGIYLDPLDGEIVMNLSCVDYKGEYDNAISLAYRNTSLNPGLCEVERYYDELKLIISEEELFTTIVEIVRSTGETV